MSTRLPDIGDSRRLVAECRDLLRNWSSPDRLHRNSLARTILGSATKLSERSFVLREAAAAALDRLEIRDHAIIQRCDIDKEPFEHVAADLGISVRHLYRERRRILESLARLFHARTEENVRVQVESEYSFQGQLRTSRVLEENGDAEAAARIIERIIAQCTDSVKYRLLLNLAELHARAGHFTRAQSYVNDAAVTVRELALGCDLSIAELSVTKASVFETCGQGSAAIAKYAASAVRFMRNTEDYRYDPHAARILLTGLFLSGRSCASRGKATELAEICNEANQVFSLVRHPDEEMQMHLHFLLASRDILCVGDVPAGRVHLSQAADIARSAGFTLSSMVQLTNLASTYRLQENPRRAVTTLENVLPIVRELGNGNVLLAVLVDLAASHAELGHYEEAQALLIEGAQIEVENEWLRAALLRTSAKVNLETGKFSTALEEARSAESRFAALGKTRLVGTPLRLQAEALLGLGARRRALRAISSSIEILSNTNTDLALGRAYSVFARITGDQRYSSKARALKPGTKG